MNKHFDQLSDGITQTQRGDRAKYKKRRLIWQVTEFFVTYICYCTFHVNRQAWSMLKYKMLDQTDKYGLPISRHYIGILDGVFLAFYSLGLFCSGMLIDSYTSKRIVNISLITTSVIIFLISYAPINDPVMYFLCATNGLVQSAAYPSCFSLIAIWIKRDKLGSLMGFWGSCAATGNVIGAYITSSLISYGFNWQATFQLIGLLNLLQLGINHMLLYEPRELNIQIENKKTLQINDELLDQRQKREKTISFKEAIKGYGTLQAGGAYFCLKFCYYGLMMWMPLYLVSSNQSISNYDVSLFVLWFEIGSMASGVTIGVITDMMSSRRYPVIVLFILFGVYFTYLLNSTKNFLLVIFLVGFTVGGTSQILSSVSAADISFKIKNKRSIATIVGIIDGFGSTGACIGQISIGYMLVNENWSMVYNLMSIMTLLSCLPLFQICYQECKELFMKN